MTFRPVGILRGIVTGPEHERAPTRGRRPFPVARVSEPRRSLHDAAASRGAGEDRHLARVRGDRAAEGQDGGHGEDGNGLQGASHGSSPVTVG